MDQEPFDYEYAVSALSEAGQGGDTTLIHIQPDQINEVARALGHKGKKNPLTGLLGFDDGEGEGGGKGGDDSGGGGGGSKGDGTGGETEGDGEGDGDGTGSGGGGSKADGSSVSDADRSKAEAGYNSLNEGISAGSNVGGGIKSDENTTIDNRSWLERQLGISTGLEIDEMGNIVNTATATVNPLGAIAGLLGGPVVGAAAGWLGSQLGLTFDVTANLGQANLDGTPSAGGHTGQDPNNPEHSDGGPMNGGGGAAGGGKKDDSKSGTKKPTTDIGNLDSPTNFDYFAMPEFRILDRNFGASPAKKGSK